MKTSRLSIDIPAEKHQQIKAQAALAGVPLKEYVVQTLLGQPVAVAAPVQPLTAAGVAVSENTDMQELLEPRIQALRQNQRSTRTMGQLIRYANERWHEGEA